MMAWISALEPTSTPTDGPLRIRTRGARASQRASTTRCWLPPERERTGTSGSGALTRSRASQSRASAARAARSRSGPRAMRLDASDADVAQDGLGQEQPFGQPILGDVADPGLGGAERIAERQLRPSSTTPTARPGRTSPNSALASAVRPEPRRPEMPSTSPARRVKATSSKMPAFESRSTVRSTGAAGSSWCRARPRQGRGPSCGGVEAAVHRTPQAGPSATFRPFRRTTTRSETSKHLGELVGDEDHGHSVRLEPPDDGREARGPRGPSGRWWARP